LLPFVLRRTPAVSEALAEGMTVMDYAPNSTVAEDFGSLAGWSRANRQPRAAPIAECAGVNDDRIGPLADIGAGENFFTRLLRLIVLLAAAACFCFLAVLPLTWPQQAVLGC